MKTSHHNLVIGAVALLLNSTAFAQGSSLPQYNVPGANFYAIKDAHDATGPIDTLNDDEEAKYKRFEAFWSSRVETGDPAFSGLFTNYSTKLSTYFDNDFCPTNVNPSPWQQMGPDHYTPQHLGRVQAMWVDPVNDPPQLIYSGTAHSGLWRSTDGAATWTNITDSYARPVHGVHSIARLTNLSPARLIIGTGRQDNENFSVGALYSDDDGATWQSCGGIPNTLTEGPIVDIKAHGNEVLAVRGKKLYRSVDHGLNFVDITPTIANISTGSAPFANNRFCGVVHHQNTGDGVIVLAAKDDDWQNAVGADLYASTDLGLSWIRISDQLPVGNHILLSQVCLVDDPGGAYHGFHILVEDNSINEARLYSGTDPTQLQLTQIFNSSACSTIAAPGYGYRYDNFTITKHGRVYTSNVKDLYAAQLGAGGCQTVLMDYYTLTFPRSHDDLNTFVVVTGATAADDRIAVGHDGGMSYRSTNGTWNDWNGASFPTVMASHIAVDEFASRILLGSIDNGNWTLQPGISSWFNPSSHSDGGMVGSYRNKEATTEAWSYIQNSRAFLIVDIAGTLGSRWHDGGFRLYHPSKLRIRNGEPTLFFVHGFGAGPAGILRMDRNNAAINLTPGPEAQHMFDCPGLDVHIDNPDFIFFGTWQRYWNPPTSPYRIMRSADGGTNWTDLTLNLTNPNSNMWDPNLFSRYGVNSIAIDPESDPNDINQQVVYVGMVGLPNADGFERVFKSVDGGQTWADMSNGLPGFPVNNLACQPGSGGVLYAATDVGVFVYKPSVGAWECFNDGMPICIVTGLEVNMCTGKLYASTYGRSSFETDLYMPPTPTELVINTDQTINDLNSAKTIRVMQGATLTITGAVDFQENNKLIIEKGARVIVDGGTLSSRCSGFWAGIDIYGDNTQNQHPSTHPTHQGMLKIINGGTVEYAREINVRGPNWNSFGGVIQASDANFVNCRRSAQFMAYQNTNAGGYPVANRSYFTRCHFYVDDDYPGGDDFHTHVSMWKVDGIQFNACTFENLQTTITESAKLGLGITSIDASYIVRGICATSPPWVGGTCPSYTPTTFRGLDLGIDARSFGSGKKFIVDHCLFEDNVCGVYANAVIGFQVKNSVFKVGDENLPALTGDVDIKFNDRHRAVFSTESWSFAIDDNVVEQQGSYAETEGIVVGYTRDHDDMVFRNNVTGLEVGYIGEGISADVNGNAATRGLWFLCNENTNNLYNLWARKVTSDQINDPDDHTIRLDQGTSNRPVDNKLDQWANGSANYDFFVTTSNDQMTYWQRSGAQYELTNYTTGVSGISPDLATSIPTNNCASKILLLPPLPWPPPVDEFPTATVKSYLLDEKLAYGNTRYLYEQLIDDGNTDEVVQEIEASWPQDAWELRGYLLAKSPYLSVKVLKEMVEKNIMPAAMVTEVLVANPEATRQDRFLDWIQQSHHPLPEYMLNLVVASWDQRTYRATLENELTQHHSAMVQSGNMLLHHYADLPYASNDSIVIPTDSVLWVWQQLRTPSARYAEAMILIEGNQFQAATIVIENIPVEHNLKAPEALERQRMLDLITFMGTLVNNGKNEMQLDQGEVQSLKNMMGTAYDRPAAWISNLLCFAYQDCRPPMTGGTFDGTAKALPRANEPERAAVVQAQLTIQPNPASAWVAFDYDLLVPPTDAYLVIRDLSGREVHRKAILEQKHQLLWDTRLIGSGTYIVTLVNKERDLRTEKLVIQQ
ncbi:MAG: exo-alpha-sialidase [Flavobacteriales bacterium]|nr:exo-alpha-sialidase [Flavobacteriales bacterium]